MVNSTEFLNDTQLIEIGKKLVEYLNHKDTCIYLDGTDISDAEILYTIINRYNTVIKLHDRFEIITNKIIRN